MIGKQWMVAGVLGMVLGTVCSWQPHAARSRVVTGVTESAPSEGRGALERLLVSALDHEASRLMSADAFDYLRTKPAWGRRSAPECVMTGCLAGAGLYRGGVDVRWWHLELSPARAGRELVALVTPRYEPHSATILILDARGALLRRESVLTRHGEVSGVRWVKAPDGSRALELDHVFGSTGYPCDAASVRWPKRARGSGGVPRTPGYMQTVRTRIGPDGVRARWVLRDENLCLIGRHNLALPEDSAGVYEQCDVRAEGDALVHRCLVVTRWNSEGGVLRRRAVRWRWDAAARLWRR